MAAIYERTKGESTKAFTAFCAYRDTPATERSIVKAVSEYYKIELEAGSVKQATKVRLWQKWSSQHNWVKRSHAWDAKKDEVARAAQLKAIEKMQERHINVAMMVQGKALDFLQKIATSGDGAITLSSSEILRYIAEGIRIERLSRGVADQAIDIGVNENGPLSGIRGPRVSEIIVEIPSTSLSDRSRSILDRDGEEEKESPDEE